MSRGRVLPLFALCAAALIGVMAWLTLTVRRLEDAERRSRAEAALEETVRLALWRMESQLAPLIAQESAHPYYLYRSPLPQPSSPYVRLRFQWDAQGGLSSPQVSEPSAVGDRRARGSLAAAGRLADRATLLARLSAEWIQVEPPSVITAPDRGELQRRQEAARQAEAKRAEAKQRVEAQSREAETSKAEPRQKALGVEETALQQQSISKLEYLARAASNTGNLEVRGLGPPRRPAPSFDTTEVRVGRLQPVWLEGELVLARRVRVGTQELVQVCWLDWPALRSWLLAAVADLLPAAQLVPVAAGDGDETRRLAALPVRLLPGGASSSALPAVPSGLRLPLTAAWILAFVSLAASGALLFGMATLSERRAAFVSAVTHELRTPLTTFRIYSDMLLEGMVADEEQRRQYLATLSREAERQSHLVENVLAYSRLERGRYAASREDIRVEDLLAGVAGSLSAHAEQAGMSLLISVPAATGAATVRADRSAVERILFNLVDNACKYARGAADRRIHLDCESDARQLRLTVRDHGPGLDAREARRLFRPFHKSAREAAQTAPGVGLGLALSRRLARALGGDLRPVRAGSPGAAFCLRLPVLSP